MRRYRAQARYLQLFALSTPPFTKTNRWLATMCTNSSHNSSTQLAGSSALEGAADVRAISARIHNTPSKAVLYCSGGGATAISALLSVPNASKTILEATVPYDRGAMLDLLQTPPSSFSSREASTQLARAALRRAAQLAPPNTPLIGVGAACALATARARRGDSRTHITIATSTGYTHYTLLFSDITSEQTERRIEQERASSRLIIDAIARALNIDPPNLFHPALSPSDKLTRTFDNTPDALDAVLSGEAGYAEISKTRTLIEATCAKVILPGSFNPVHFGHRELLKAGIKLVSRDTHADVPIYGAFELSVRNPDKPTLARSTVEQRIAQFTNNNNEVILVSNAPLFTGKAKLYRDAKFVVGYDTAVRLVEPKYYGDSVGEMECAISRLGRQGCEFLVGARKDREGIVRTLEDIEIPASIRDLFRAIPQSEFLEHVSSTEIRAKRTVE